MLARLILKDQPGAWTKFTVGKHTFRARMDPMWLGVDQLYDLLYKPQLVLQLLDEKSRINAVIADPFQEHLGGLIEAYADAVGIGIEGLAIVRTVLERATALEVDLLRIGLDICDWLTPEGPLSTRRVVELIKDFRERPETQLGSTRFGVLPVDKAAIVLAQIHTGLGEEGQEPHRFLKSPEDIEREQEQLRRAAEKRERIKDLHPVELVRSGGAESFESSKAESQRMLQEILAARKGDTE